METTTTSTSELFVLLCNPGSHFDVARLHSRLASEIDAVTLPAGHLGSEGISRLQASAHAALADWHSCFSASRPRNPATWARAFAVTFTELVDTHARAMSRSMRAPAVDGPRVVVRPFAGQPATQAPVIGRAHVIGD